MDDRGHHIMSHTEEGAGSEQGACPGSSRHTRRMRRKPGRASPGVRWEWLPWPGPGPSAASYVYLFILFSTLIRPSLEGKKSGQDPSVSCLDYRPNFQWQGLGQSIRVSETNTSCSKTVKIPLNARITLLVTRNANFRISAVSDFSPVLILTRKGLGLLVTD